MAIHRLTIGEFLRYEKKANKSDMNMLFKELVQLTFYKIMGYNKTKLYLAVQGKFKTETKKEAVR